MISVLSGEIEFGAAVRTPHGDFAAQVTLVNDHIARNKLGAIRAAATDDLAILHLPGSSARQVPSRQVIAIKEIVHIHGGDEQRHLSVAAQIREEVEHVLWG